MGFVRRQGGRSVLQELSGDDVWPVTRCLLGVPTCGEGRCRRMRAHGRDVASTKSSLRVVRDTPRGCPAETAVRWSRIGPAVVHELSMRGGTGA